ncbi:MAG: hypothetical protein M1821_002464 [Bathelium mastoideum]|nr:MAG: hypothetical protein M1821_002464 [Bathelium mastoideum]
MQNEQDGWNGWNVQYWQHQSRPASQMGTTGMQIQRFGMDARKWARRARRFKDSAWMNTHLWLTIRSLNPTTAQAYPPSIGEIHALALVTGLGVDFVASWLGAALRIQFDWQYEEPENDFSSNRGTILAEVTAYVEERVARGCDLPNRQRKGEGPYQCTSKSCTYRTDNAHSWKRHRQIRQPIYVYHCSGCRSASENIMTSGRANYPEQFIEYRVDRFKKHALQKHPQAAIELILKDSAFVMPVTQGLQCGFCGASFECAEESQGVEQAAKNYENHVIDHFNRKKTNGIEWDVQTDWREPWYDDEAGLGDSDDGDDQDQDRDGDHGSKENDRHEDLDRHPDNHDHDEDFGDSGGADALDPGDLFGGTIRDVAGYQSHLERCAIPIRLRPVRDECRSEISSRETRYEMRALSDAQQSESTEEKSVSLPPVFSPPVRSVASLDSTDLVLSESSSVKPKLSRAVDPQCDQNEAIRGRRPLCGYHPPSDSTSVLDHNKPCPKSDELEHEDPASYRWEKDLLFYMVEHPGGREISPNAYQSIEAGATHESGAAKITYGASSTSTEPSSSSARHLGHWL